MSTERSAITPLADRPAYRQPTMVEGYADPRQTLADLIPIRQAATMMGVGASSAYRWARTGYPDRDGTRHILRSVRLGKQIKTSSRWIAEFIAAISESKTRGDQ